MDMASEPWAQPGPPVETSVEQIQPLVEANGLTLSLPVFHPDDRALRNNPARLLTDLYWGRTKRGVVTILDGVSFVLNPGERLGVIGPNGAGKSTLLRMVAGIYVPSGGQLSVHGSARGLFDVSLGMNPEATGLENIYMRGLQMGLGLQQIKAVVPEVIAFAGLDEAVERPLNTYSSGMRLRLAVSISTLIEPDILLLDEWVGAGDAHFSLKVKDRMNGLIRKSRGLILATHNEALMESLCTHGMVLSGGKVRYYGTLEDALIFYKQMIAT
jgi:ABC-type polysaccharide/polyol phosphate transport system ATPase subunit